MTRLKQHLTEAEIENRRIEGLTPSVGILISDSQPLASAVARWSSICSGRGGVVIRLRIRRIEGLTPF